MQNYHQETLFGWGKYPQIQANITIPQNRNEWIKAISSQQNDDSKKLAFGLGRSYGDVALLDQNQGQIIKTTQMNHYLSFDENTGWLKCQAGVSILDLIQSFLPRGFFPPVVPGTQFVTLGGAIANDIHGKNHHVDGTISDHVRNVEILKADGEIVFCDANQNAELFWATVGGIGLTGQILSLEIKLQAVGGPGIEMESIRVNDLDHFFEISSESGAFTHTVSWIDCATQGKHMGRGIFMRGRHTDEKPNPRLIGQLAQKISPLLEVPFDAPSILMNPWTIKAFNEAYFRKHPAGKLSQIVGYEPFFFPLDFVRDWNRIYGARGFLQYQLVVPHDPQHTAIRKVLTTITQSGMGSFLAVIKEFGEQTHPYLSFPRPGVTLALDFPNYGQALFDLLDQLDLIVLEAGGRVYLGKDARLPKAHFQAMYPEWETWKNLKEKYDPSGRFSSLLAKRLGLL